MTTTMKTLAGHDTFRILLIGLEDGRKVCEVDITEMSPREVGEVIQLQEMQGRSWEYQTISTFTFPDFDREHD